MSARQVYKQLYSMPMLAWHVMVPVKVALHTCSLQCRRTHLDNEWKSDYPSIIWVNRNNLFESNVNWRRLLEAIHVYKNKRHRGKCILREVQYTKELVPGPWQDRNCFVNMIEISYVICNYSYEMTALCENACVFFDDFKILLTISCK